MFLLFYLKIWVRDRKIDLLSAGSQWPELRLITRCCLHPQINARRSWKSIQRWTMYLKGWCTVMSADNLFLPEEKGCFPYQSLDRSFKGSWVMTKLDIQMGRRLNGAWVPLTSMFLCLEIPWHLHVGLQGTCAHHGTLCLMGNEAQVQDGEQVCWAYSHIELAQKRLRFIQCKAPAQMLLAISDLPH